MKGLEMYPWLEGVIKRSFRTWPNAGFGADLLDYLKRDDVDTPMGILNIFSYNSANFMPPSDKRLRRRKKDMRASLYSCSIFLLVGALSILHPLPVVILAALLAFLALGNRDWKWAVFAVGIGIGSLYFPEVVMMIGGMFCLAMGVDHAADYMRSRTKEDLAIDNMLAPLADVFLTFGIMAAPLSIMLNMRIEMPLWAMGLLILMATVVFVWWWRPRQLYLLSEKHYHLCIQNFWEQVLLHLPDDQVQTMWRYLTVSHGHQTLFTKQMEEQLQARVPALMPS